MDAMPLLKSAFSLKWDWKDLQKVVEISEGIDKDSRLLTLWPSACR